MYNSRRYPLTLLSINTPSSEGCLIPFVDLFNHNPGVKITWKPVEDGVQFITNQIVEKGRQVYNNYGPKSNGTLMFIYGFFIEGNLFDTYTLHLKGGDDISYGVFEIRRKECLIGEQFDSRLWEVLRDILYEVDSGDEGEGVGVEEVEVLLKTLKGRLEEIQQIIDDTTELESEGVNEYERIAIRGYIDGQRLVLEEAVETLEEMLEGVEDEEG